MFGTLRTASLLSLYCLLVACSGDGKSKEDEVPDGQLETQLSISGSIGDGPVINARVVATDRSGREVAQTLSDNSAKYQLDLPASSEFPITITATGGTDLVTNAPPTFDLVSVLQDDKQTTVNATPISTMIVNAALCRDGGLTTNNLAAAHAAITNEFSGGLDPSAASDPIHSDVDDANVAEVVKANQVVAEIVTRTGTALEQRGRGTSLPRIIRAIACDLSDGRLDGAGGSETDAETTALTKAAVANVYAEALLNQLQVGGQSAQARLNSAIQRIAPNAPASENVESVQITPRFAREVRRALVAVSALAPDEQLVALTQGLLELEQASEPSTLPDTVRNHLTAANDVLTQAIAADANQLDEVATTHQSTPSSIPELTLNADKSTVARGESAQLTWSANNATTCIATEGATGSLPLTGNMTTAPLDAPLTVSVTCLNAIGSARKSIRIDVTTPHVTITADRTVAASGDRITLNWEAGHVNQCSAFGGWSGNLGLRGSQLVGPITADTIFGLRCSSGNSNVESQVAVAFQAAAVTPDLTLTTSATAVDLNGSATLSWTSANAQSCTASGSWSGDKAPNGSQALSNISAPGEYRMTCSGAGGEITRAVTVAVRGPAITQFAAAQSVLDSGQSTNLTWASTNATSCTASGAWAGALTPNGNRTTNALSRNSTFTLTCSGPGGTTPARSVQVRLRPTVSLRASSDFVITGAPVTLTWQSENATACTATSPDTRFNGAIAISGSVLSSPLTTNSTFNLRCTNTAGEAVATVSVLVQGTRVRWTPPTQMTDGSAIQTLRGFNIRYGTASGNYSQTENVLDPTATSQVIPLAPGNWFIVVTALADVTKADGTVEVRESAYSTEVSKTIP